MEQVTITDMNLIKAIKKAISSLLQLQTHDLKSVTFSSSDNFFKTLQTESDPKIDFSDVDLKEVREKIFDYQSHYDKNITSVGFHINTGKFFVNWCK